MGKSLEEIQANQIHAALYRAGYVGFHSPYGRIYVPPGYPLTQRSGFIPLEPGDPGFEATKKETDK
jgi:hypothetical protein